MRKLFSILALIALYDICGFCLTKGYNNLAFFSWFAFMGLAAHYIFVMTTKFIIMLFELPKSAKESKETEIVFKRLYELIDKWEEWYDKFD